MGSLRHTRTLEQFRVLNPAEIAKADAALHAALAVARNDGPVNQRIQIVKTVYEFAALGARQYWLLEQLRAARPQSEADALRSLATAREIIAAARQQAELKDRVLTQPPVAHYANYAKTPGKPGNNTLFIAVEKDALLPEVGIGIARAFENVGDALRTRAGAERDRVVAGSIPPEHRAAARARLPAGHPARQRRRVAGDGSGFRI